MHFKLAAAITLGYFLSIASAATHNVSVGVDNKDNYEPEFLSNVNSGDTIHFSFVSQIPHSITESTFDEPCVTKLGGQDSGVLRNTSAYPQWTMTVTNASEPLWFYCTVGTHCSGFGMVFAINPSSNQSFEAFQAKAFGKSISSSGGLGASTSLSSTSTTSASGSASLATPSGSKSGGIKASINEMTFALAFAVLFVCLSF